jgi:hypothetical protein
MRFLFSIVTIISFGLIFSQKKKKRSNCLASAVIARSEGELEVV